MYYSKALIVFNLAQYNPGKYGYSFGVIVRVHCYSSKPQVHDVSIHNGE